MTGLEGLEDLDFSIPPELLNPKRPHELDDEAHDDSEAKRLKLETTTHEDHHEDDNSLEDGLALLVQNALSNVGDLVGHFDASVDTSPHDPMDLDTVALLESVAPLPTFHSDPLKYVRQVQTHSLGNLVSCPFAFTCFNGKY